MNKLVVLLLCMYSLSVFSQDSLRIRRIEDFFPVINKKIIYTEVVNLDSSLNKNLIYINAKDFLTKNFSSGKEVTQVDDKENGIIIIKAFFTIKGHNGMVSNPQMWFLLKIEIKDNKFKYTISELWYKGSIFFNGVRTEIDKDLEDWSGAYADISFKPKKEQNIYDGLKPFMVQIDENFKNLIVNMKKELSTTNKSDW